MQRVRVRVVASAASATVRARLGALASVVHYVYRGLRGLTCTSARRSVDAVAAIAACAVAVARAAKARCLATSTRSAVPYLATSVAVVGGSAKLRVNRAEAARLRVEAQGEELCSRCGLCDTPFVSEVASACAFIGEGMARIDVHRVTTTSHSPTSAPFVVLVYHPLLSATTPS
ncbi:hypothetical protein T492DRAFT_882251 [Pavlovales sp. CCMP2436]|nr:hypothetical protein T492DRAFT_882251 [Pavlovales sp. CCMP2436]